MLMKNIN